MVLKQIPKNEGFTLLEITLIIAIIAILATMGYGYYQRDVARANVTELVTNIDVMRTAFAILEAEDGPIPHFQGATPGTLPPELSSLNISPSVLQFPGLNLGITSNSFRGDIERPYLVISTHDSVGSLDLTELANLLPDRHFFWVSEPLIAFVPLIGENAFSGVHLPPPTTAAQPAPSKIVLASQSSLDTATKIFETGLHELSSTQQNELVQYLHDAQAAIDRGDSHSALISLDAFDSFLKSAEMRAALGGAVDAFSSGISPTITELQLINN